MHSSRRRRSNRQPTTASLSILILLLLVQAKAIALAGEAPISGIPIELLGDWEGEGELFGKPAAFSMSWERVLDGQFVKLTFENRLVENGKSRRLLEAVAYYRPGEANRLTGTWLDTRGQTLELRATAAASTLETHWRSDSEQGRTVYRFTDEDTVEVHDDVLGENGWRPFGSAIYRRASRD